MHRLALGPSLLRKVSFDIELLAAPSRTREVGPPVFINGLARAGTTILMRIFHDTGQFRSLTYRDMPFVLMPGIWARLSKFFHKQEEAKERSHGDGILVNFDSPEAFEEVFWKTFCDDSYIAKTQLSPHNVGTEVISQFQDYVKQVISSAETPQQCRYLSKNNNNILRLPAIRKAFPKGLILIPFRDPVQQSISLLQQHNQFCELHANDPFGHDYMAWLGHHEFGGTHKPFRFTANVAHMGNAHQPDSLNYWLSIWVDTYGYLLSSAPSDCIFFSFETLCRSPKPVLEKLFELAGLVLEKDFQEDKIKPPKLKDANELDENLVQLAQNIYTELSKRSEAALK